MNRIVLSGKNQMKARSRTLTSEIHACRSALLRRRRHEERRLTVAHVEQEEREGLALVGDDAGGEVEGRLDRAANCAATV